MSGRNLKQLFLSYRAEIHTYLVKQLQDIELAADLTQETFLRYAQQPDDGAILQERAYLYRTARNLAIDHLRARQRQQTRSTPNEVLAGIAEDRPSLEDATDAKERLALLEGIVEELPLRTRQVLILIRIEGRSYSETAELMQVSISAVQKHMNFAIRYMTSRLRR
ncbi:RNA polymerase sigma factor [Ferrovibrio terrae]|uniref:RNA polymerase sigma factor n=1 Tax=Ferrovibrio terrae TaxID=2594003 RepID=A0A516H383_9PROT|nr:RNA polymerase sigma factor [Ferrovibrio terrae]QDO98234.1 RNA polymerase sigma factor [Ferrovibrio terrae]